MDEDQEAELAYVTWLAEDRDRRCPRCHTLPSDWVDEHGREYRDPAYVVKIVDCHGCATLEDDDQPLGSTQTKVLVPFDPDAPFEAMHPDDPGE